MPMERSRCKESTGTNCVQFRGKLDSEIYSKVDEKFMFLWSGNLQFYLFSSVWIMNPWVLFELCISLLTFLSFLFYQEHLSMRWVMLIWLSKPDWWTKLCINWATLCITLIIFIYQVSNFCRLYSKTMLVSRAWHISWSLPRCDIM